MLSSSVDSVVDRFNVYLRLALGAMIMYNTWIDIEE